MPNLAKISKMAIVATYVSPGVKVDAGGFVIINGKIVRVPPRSPEIQALHKAVQGVMALANKGVTAKAKGMAA